VTEAGRIALAARVFTLAAVGSICVARGIGFQGLGLILVVAIAAESFSLSTSLPAERVAVIEGGLVSVAVVAAYPVNDATFPYLAIPALVAGLHAGWRAGVLVVVAEMVLLSVLSIAWIDGYSAAMLGSWVTWLITALGLGYLGSIVRQTLATSSTDSSYRDALQLIKQLHALSGRLESGLDPVSIAEQLMGRVSGRIVLQQSVVLLRSGQNSFSPLRYSPGAQPGTFDDAEGLLGQCWATQTRTSQGSSVAVPLVADGESVAVLLAECDGEVDVSEWRELDDLLAREAVRLRAALLFTDVREAATNQERQRIAREVHDGVAQDVASLGYLIDSLADGASDDQEAERFATLRAEVSRVVKELRNSVFDLRNEVAAGQGLGQSIATFARHVGSHSPMTVHVTLDEASIRLRPDVEAELLRIGQEAINNARRHSSAKNLWIRVRVHPPQAEIRIVDDGAGLGEGRADSHGLSIMRERAERIGADLKLVSPAMDGKGTRLTVHIGPPDNQHSRTRPG
jgi:signal transduction histidine kinase